MINDIVIGCGIPGNSAIVVSGYKDRNFSIAQNGFSYWISNAFMSFGAVIFKNTTVGQNIKSMIENKEPIENIKNVIEKAVLPLIDPVRLRYAINNEIEQAERRGRNQKASEIMAALRKE